ncbi:MAG TPA: DegV family protein [Candidatus Nanopelagicales bacterium]
MSVAIVSDSTGYLTPDLTPPGLTVVPVAVILDGRSYDEGVEISLAEVADALRRKEAVSTSRPAPARFAAAYAAAAEAGHEAVVSVHLSGDLSGTLDAARIAARGCAIPVTTVDSRTVGTALGFAVRAAAAAAAAGASAEEVAAVASRAAADSRTWIVVDSLDQLRRGGRIGAAQALLGNALMVKPILGLEDGMIVPLEKLRTMSRAVARMAEMASAYAGSRACDVIVQHCAAPERAGELAETLGEALPAGDVHLVEVGAVISAHVGLGTVSVAVCPR